MEEEIEDVDQSPNSVPILLDLAFASNVCSLSKYLYLYLAHDTNFFLILTNFLLKVRYLDDHEMYMSSSIELYKTLPYASGVRIRRKFN